MASLIEFFSPAGPHTKLPLLFTLCMNYKELKVLFGDEINRYTPFDMFWFQLRQKIMNNDIFITFYSIKKVFFN